MIYLPPSFLLFSGSSNEPLAKEVAAHLSASLGSVTRSRFADGEAIIRFQTPLTNQPIFILQSILPNDPFSLIELGLLIDAAKEAGAKSVTAVIPYWGYAKQDRCAVPGDPISSRVMAKWLSSAGCDSAIILDIHSPKAASYFSIPVQFVSAMPLLAQSFVHLDPQQTVVASPDKGGIVRAQSFADQLHLPLVTMEKHRPKANESEVTQLNGDVKGKTVILVDDEINTAGTITNAAAFLAQSGARHVLAAAVHGVLADPAMERINASPFEKILFTNTLPLPSHPKIVSVSVASLLAQSILDSSRLA